MATELIKINEFPEVSDLDLMKWIVLADESGIAYKISRDKFKSGLSIKLRLSDTDYVQVTGGNTIVSHPELIGFEDYIISTTQLNIAAFRDDDLIIDKTLGKATILNFELLSSEVIIIYPPSVSWGADSGGGVISNLVNRVNILESVTAPFMTSGSGESMASVWWRGTINTIPAGWVEDFDMRGKFPIGMDTVDPDFNAVGKTGGEKSVTLSSDQQGRFTVGLMPDRSGGTTSQRQFRGVRMKPEGALTWSFQQDSADTAYQQWGPDQNVGLGDAQEEHTNLPPYKVGVWIKYVGV